MNYSVEKADEIYAVAKEAYFYAYPIVSMDTTMRQATNVLQYGAMMGAKPAASKSAHPPDPPSLEAVVSPLTFPTILPPFGIAIALTIVVGVSQLGLNTTPVLIRLPSLYFRMPMCQSTGSQHHPCLGTAAGHAAQSAGNAGGTIDFRFS